MLEQNDGVNDSKTFGGLRLAATEALQINHTFGATPFAEGGVPNGSQRDVPLGLSQPSLGQKTNEA